MGRERVAGSERVRGNEGDEFDEFDEFAGGAGLRPAPTLTQRRDDVAQR